MYKHLPMEHDSDSKELSGNWSNNAPAFGNSEISSVNRSHVVLDLQKGSMLINYYLVIS